MDRATLRHHVDGVTAAVTDLERLMAEVHDLGGVGFPHTKVSCRCEIGEGYAFCHTPTPILHVTWPSTLHASAHRTLAVESLRTRWNSEGRTFAQTLVHRLEHTLDALFEEGLPTGATGAHHVAVEIHVGAHTEWFLGWDPVTDSSILMGLTGMGLHPTQDVETIVDLLRHTDRLVHAPGFLGPDQTSVWKLRAVVSHAHNPHEHVTDDHQVRAVDAADAVLRTALSGSNALLCPQRLLSLDVWRHDSTHTHALLDAIARRNTP